MFKRTWQFTRINNPDALIHSDSLAAEKWLSEAAVTIIELFGVRERLRAEHDCNAVTVNATMEQIKMQRVVAELRGQRPVIRDLDEVCGNAWSAKRAAGAEFRRVSGIIDDLCAALFDCIHLPSDSKRTRFEELCAELDVSELIASTAVPSEPIEMPQLDIETLSVGATDLI